MERTRIDRRALIGAMASLPIAASLPARAAGASGEFWIVRHGESDINVIPPGTKVVDKDDGVRFPLTAKGIDQVVELGRGVSGAGIKPSAIFSSTRLRTIQTADAISFATRVPIKPAEPLVEIAVGNLEGAAEDAFKQLYHRWFHGELDVKAPEGESRRDVENRGLPFLREKIAEFAAAPGPLIFVTHGAFTAMTAPRLFDNVTDAFAFANHLPNAGVVKGVFDGKSCRCVQWGDKKP